MEYTKQTLEVSIHSVSSPNMRVMRGKALMDEASADLKFVENEARGARSVEVGRTAHSRFVRRPDGAYTITLRCNGNEKYLREALIAEVGDIVKTIKLDLSLIKQEEKRKEKGDGEESKQ